MHALVLKLHTARAMNKTIALASSIFLGMTLSAFAQEDKTPPGLEKKGGVPPGLQKKGGLPPGQAKKQDEQPLAQQPAPPAAAAPAKPAAPAASVPAVPAPAPAPAASNTRELKARLDLAVEETQDRVKEQHIGPAALKEIHRLTGVPLTRLQEFRDAHKTGFPALLLGNLIAKQSNASFRDLLAMRANGKRWSEIAERHNVAIEPLLDKMVEFKRHLREVEQRRS